MATDPSEAVLEWRNVTYSIAAPKSEGKSSEVKKSRRAILNDVSGKVLSGQFLAIMGPSGSGKTSLLNALAGRIEVTKEAELTGEITVNGEDATDFLANHSAYIMQDDALFALSTVFETLMFVAQLRLPKTMPIADKKARVVEVITELGLITSKDTLVGNQRVRGLSGGERKRLNIGVDMLHNPRLLFCDEPTSGLDSFQALAVMETLAELAKKGRVVVCSVHQPRSSIYAMLDQVILLSMGNPMYNGAAGDACDAYFAKAGHPVPNSFNPADHYMDAISIDYRTLDKTEASSKQVEDLKAFYLASNAEGDSNGYDAVGLALEEGTATEGEKRRGVGSGASQTTNGGPSLWMALLLLARRSWKEQTRDKTALIIKYVLNTFFTLMFSFVYFRMPFDQTSLQDRTGILFFQAMNQAFGSSIGISQVIPVQLKVVRRERAAGLYGSLPYFLATFLTVIPLEAVPQLVYTIALYFLTGLRPGVSHVFTFVGIMMLENFVAIGLGLVLSASFKEPEMAGQIAPAVVVLFLMFSGYFLNEASIPAWIGWIKYISFIRYAFQALCVNEFSGGTFTCSEDDLAISRCLQGDQWLEQLDFADVSVGLNCMYLAIMIAGFNLLAYVILTRNAPKFLGIRQKEL